MPDHNLEDQPLVDRLRREVKSAAEISAHEVLWRRHESSLRRFLGKRGEDLLQCAFLRARSSFHTFRLGSNFPAWIKTIICRLEIDDKRAAKRRNEWSLDTKLEDGGEAGHAEPGEWLIDPRVDVEDEATTRVLVEQIKEAFAILPERQRTILGLIFVAGYTQTDVARKLGINRELVIYHQNQGLKRLREHLHADQEAPSGGGPGGGANV